MNLKDILLKIPLIGEFIGRLFSSNPSFFKKIQAIAAILAVIGGVIKLGIIPAGTFLDGLNSGIAYALEFTAAVIAQLPNPNLPVTTTKQ